MRKGSQHSQEGFIPFIKRVIEKARSLTSRKLLVAPGFRPRCAGYPSCLGGSKECQLYRKVESPKGRPEQMGGANFQGG